jgi:hypothetical protein
MAAFFPEKIPSLDNHFPPPSSLVLPEFPTEGKLPEICPGKLLKTALLLATNNGFGHFTYFLC